MPVGEFRAPIGGYLFKPDETLFEVSWNLILTSCSIGLQATYLFYACLFGFVFSSRLFCPSFHLSGQVPWGQRLEHAAAEP